ncbi:Sigma-C [Avian orthoreovirus]|uniref:Sigma-C n=1 Tax=Avian orthoreovirus TaxID=38170 RepID=A0A0B5GP74_9REOV|nr:Sigma-C [Avian orthoreovirus]
MEGLTQSQRREVVRLILSLTSNVIINPGDLTELRERVSALESATASLNGTVEGVLDQLVDLARKLGNAAGAVVDLRGELNSLTANIQTIQSSLGSLTDSISDLSDQVTTNTSSLTNLGSMVAGLTVDVTNLKRDVSNQGLQITSLEKRVTSLESGAGSIPTFAAPLKLDSGIVSLDLDPYFCSVDHNLTSYSASALLMNFQWLVRGEEGSSDSFDMSVTAHSHGQRTDFMMSTTQSLTVTGNSVTLVFDLNALISPPSDYSRLIPCRGFQQATFPVDLSFKRDDVTHSYQVYGSYTTPRIFKITFSPGNPVPAVIRFITVRTGIDT